MDIRGVIFDFDGVIAASEPLHGEAWVRLGQVLNKDLPHGFVDKGVGLTDSELAHELADFWQGSPDSAYIFGEKQRLYQEKAHKHCPLIPGIKEALKTLSARFPIAIATSSSREDISGIVENNGLANFFKAILTVDDVTKPKPAPEIYQRAAQSLGLMPEHCLAFEDSKAGTTAARAAGCHLVALTTTAPKEKLAPYTDIIPDFTHAPDLFQRLGILS